MNEDFPVSGSNPIRVGVVGFGYWDPNLVRNVHKLTDAELVAVCDATPANLAKFAAAYPEAPTCDSLDAMLATHASYGSWCVK